MFDASAFVGLFCQKLDIAVRSQRWARRILRWHTSLVARMLPQPEWDVCRTFNFLLHVMS